MSGQIGEVFDGDYYYNENSVYIDESTMNTFETDDSDIDQANFPPTLSDRYDGRDFEYRDPKKIENQQNSEKKTKETSTPNLSGLFQVLEIVAYVFLVFIVGFVFYMIMNREGSWKFGKFSDKKVVKLEAIEEDVKDMNLEELIAQALVNKDFRLAIRYNYLNIIKFLATKEIIKYDPDKTNLDYMNEISNQEQKSDFSYLSYIYNYIWYGEFEISEKEYQVAEKSFNQFIV
ncbi:MAG: DUF4129 domain-containing protein [Flavobacteriaceae bacterium]|nr:DUF4129 domain-containing protein [Flavobacteriaceae bacterium]